jgi:hypothetical protein
MPDQNCPLCESIANYKLVNYGRFKYFVCPKCSHFVITSATEQRLQKDWLDSISTQASKLSAVKLLFIAFDANGELILDEQLRSEWG